MAVTRVDASWEHMHRLLTSALDGKIVTHVARTITKIACDTVKAIADQQNSKRLSNETTRPENSVALRDVLKQLVTSPPIECDHSSGYLVKDSIIHKGFILCEGFVHRHMRWEQHQNGNHFIAIASSLEVSTTRHLQKTLVC